MKGREFVQPMAVLGTMVNSFGGRWFNEEWEPQLDSPAWSEAINFYVDMMGKYGPPGGKQLVRSGVPWDSANVRA